MMFGTRERFTYVACAGCGCLYLRDVPDDLARYYPSDYYSFAVPRDTWRRRPVRWARAMRMRHALGDRNLPGAVLQLVAGYPESARWLAETGTTREGRIVDVGSGAGHRIFELADAGFSDVRGVEPYLDTEELRLPNGVVITRTDRDLDAGSCDLLMMHHSLEHMRHQDQALARAFELLRPGGHVLVRIPVVGFAWRTYGTDWVQLDAPRHLVIHTEQSLARLAEGAGFAVTGSYYDSTDFQFWASELYREGVPFVELDRHVAERGLRRGSRRRRALQAKADRLNAQRDGDRAVFFLRKPT